MKRSKLFIALALMVGSAAFGLSSFKKALTPSVNFKEAQMTDGMVQVYGDVIRTQVQYDLRTGTLQFPLKDHAGQVMQVVSHDGKPNNFDKAEKVVAVGRCENGVFQADHLLTKCPSKYKAEDSSTVKKTAPSSDPTTLFQRTSNTSPKPETVTGG